VLLLTMGSVDTGRGGPIEVDKVDGLHGLALYYCMAVMLYVMCDDLLWWCLNGKGLYHMPCTMLTAFSNRHFQPRTMASAPLRMRPNSWGLKLSPSFPRLGMYLLKLVCMNEVIMILFRLGPALWSLGTSRPKPAKLHVHLVT
jgi:hypothetical protein